MAFQKGHKFAKGGARKGAGRDADWLREKCRGLIERHKLIEFIADVAQGKHPGADMKDRLKAADMLLDRGFGKPEQGVDLKSDGAAGNLVIIARHQ